MTIVYYVTISCRQAGLLPLNRAKGCTKEVLDEWFSGYREFLTEHGLLDKPERVYNGDEAGFPLQQTSGKVQAPRGARTVYSLSPNSKQQITTLACISAAGCSIPPMHVFPGESFGPIP